MAKPATGQRGAERPPPAPQQRPLLKATQLHGARPDCSPVWGEREPLRDEYAESNTSVEARPPDTDRGPKSHRPLPSRHLEWGLPLSGCWVGPSGTKALDSHALAAPVPATSLLWAPGPSKGEQGPALPSSQWRVVQVGPAHLVGHSGSYDATRGQMCPSCPQGRPPGSLHQRHPALSPCKCGSPTRAAGSPAGSSGHSHVGAIRGPAERAGSLPHGSQKEKMAKPQFVKIRNLLKRKKGQAKPGSGSPVRPARLSGGARPVARGVPATTADQRGAWGSASPGH